MSTKTTRKAPAPPSKRPERKWGPFHAGVAVCVWLNEFATANGLRYHRSITISPRRYLDEKDGKWKDSGSFRPADLPSLVLALSAAHDYVSNTPLPGEGMDGDEVPADSEEAMSA